MVLSFLKSHHQTKAVSLNHLVCTVCIFLPNFQKYVEGGFITLLFLF